MAVMRADKTQSGEKIRWEGLMVEPQMALKWEELKGMELVVELAQEA